MASCKNCGREIDKTIGYKVGKASWYCNEVCYSEKLEKRSKQKNKYEPIDGTERRDYTDYIQKIYLDNGYDKSEINWTMIMSQTKNMLSEHPNWSYYTLRYILYYMYEIIEINLFSNDSNGSIINLIPYYSLDAEKFYNNWSNVQDKIEEFDFENGSKIKVIKANKSSRGKRNSLIFFDDIDYLT